MQSTDSTKPDVADGRPCPGAAYPPIRTRADIGLLCVLQTGPRCLAFLCVFQREERLPLASLRPGAQSGADAWLLMMKGRAPNAVGIHYDSHCFALEAREQ
jgi:hypothetical protein